MKENRFTHILCYPEYLTPHIEEMNNDGWHILSISYMKAAEKWAYIFWEREEKVDVVRSYYGA